ncbi:hypothetical protein HY251_13545 [bacterium]|nr:hypothetical protein [bacterium]
MSQKSRWQEPEAERGREESDGLELAMRSILRMFADGNLVYRSRDRRVAIDVTRPSDRLRRIRQQALSQQSPAAAV